MTPWTYKVQMSCDWAAIKLRMEYFQKFISLDLQISSE